MCEAAFETRESREAVHRILRAGHGGVEVDGDSHAMTLRREALEPRCEFVEQGAIGEVASQRLAGRLASCDRALEFAMRARTPSGVGISKGVKSGFEFAVAIRRSERRGSVCSGEDEERLLGPAPDLAYGPFERTIGIVVVGIAEEVAGAEERGARRPGEFHRVEEHSAETLGKPGTPPRVGAEVEHRTHGAVGDGIVVPQEDAPA